MFDTGLYGAILKSLYLERSDGAAASLAPLNVSKTPR
jgi:hypothetical protein